jgi:AraC-like DNA-binding protein
MKGKLFGFFRSLLSRKNRIIKEDELEPVIQPSELIKYRLEEFMYQKRPFLQLRYSIKDLSRDLQMPSYQLSAFLNQRLRVNFNDYLNRFRIEYCEELIKNKGNSKLNLQALATKCGFHNRNTFTAAFKKFTGKTPSEYTKRLSQTNSG